MKPDLSRSQEPPPDFELPLLDESGVEALAERLAARIKGGEIILLEGALGAGKTFFTRALASALGVAGGVSSPTYVLLCSHAARNGLTLHHLDFYRLTRESDGEELGIEDLCGEDSIVVAEWPDRCPGVFESFTLRLRLEVVDETHRRIHGWWGELPIQRAGFAD